MRKILLLVVALAPVFLFGQAQRTVLVEEWTNASCGPCAGQNPEFNALLDANAENVIPLKFQWFFPGYDPFQEQNPDECNNRASYYGVNGVPTAFIDGVKPGDSYAGGAGGWDIAGGGYEGGPYGYNQAAIDWATSQTTPIEMVATVVSNDAFSELTIEVAVTNVSAEDFVMADGRIQVALTEKEVIFNSAPGSNGETEFHDVMRRMYPSEEGSPVPTIAAGETWTFSITGDIPTYIYSLGELNVVTFVQDHSSKEVWQAAEGAVQFTSNFVNNAAITELGGLPENICSGEQTITPSVKVQNNGNDALTSADIVYSVNGGAEQTFAWTGNLLTLNSETVVLDAITFDALPADNTVAVAVTNPNGVADENNDDDAVSGDLALAPLAVNVVELTLKTDDYANENYWQVTNSAGEVVASGGNAGVGVTNYDVGAGSPPADAGSYDNDNIFTEEILLPANDCYTFTITDYWGDGICCTYGDGFFRLKDHNGITIYEGGEFAGRLDLPISGESVVGTEELTQVTEISMFPNPVKDMMTVNFNLVESTDLQLEVFNAMGQRVQNIGTQNYGAGNNHVSVDASDLSNGVYFLRMFNANRELSHRFVVQH